MTPRISPSTKAASISSSDPESLPSRNTLAITEPLNSNSDGFISHNSLEPAYSQLPSSTIAVGSKFIAVGSVQPEQVSLSFRGSLSQTPHWSRYESPPSTPLQSSTSPPPPV